MSGLELLQNISYLATGLTVLVLLFCIWLWHKPTDRDELRRQAEKYGIWYGISSAAARDAFIDAPDLDYGGGTWLASMHYSLAVAQIRLVQAKYYVLRLYYLTARYQEFWAVAIFIAWMGAGSLLSMYLYSLPPPCAARHDCAVTQARGIYTDDYHE